MRYRGVDRRTRGPVGDGTRGPLVTAAALALVSAVAVAGLAWLAPAAVPAVEDLAVVVRVGAAAWAGAALALAWRSGGRAADGWVAAAVGVMALGMPVAYWTDRLLLGDAGYGAWPSAPVSVLAAVPLLLLAGRGPEVDTSLTALRLVRCTAASLVVVSAASAAGHVGSGGGGGAVAAGVDVLAALVVTVVLAPARAVERYVRTTVVGAVLLSALARAAEELLAGRQPVTALVVVPALVVAAGLLVHLAATRQLVAHHEARRREVRLLRRLWTETSRRDRDSVRRHDVRGALAAVSLAGEVLLRSGEDIPARDRERLTDSVLDELQRLAALLRPEAEEDPLERLHDAVLRWRRGGGAAACDLEHLPALVCEQGALQDVDDHLDALWRAGVRRLAVAATVVAGTLEVVVSAEPRPRSPGVLPLQRPSAGSGRRVLRVPVRRRPRAPAREIS